MFWFSQLLEVKETCKFEESSGTASALSQVKGNLRRHVEFWHGIGAPDIISYMRGLPFVFSANSSRNIRSALDHSEFVYEVILELLHSEGLRN